MKHTIFVEGKEDIPFIETLTSNITVKEIIIDKFQGGGQNNKSIVITRLKSFLTDFQINPSEKLGIILDLDEYSVEQRLDFLNDCIEEVFGIRLDGVGVFRKIEQFDMPLEIGCYFINPNLDVLLRKIANQKAAVADCLYSCLEKDITIKAKERDKAWVYYYMRYDICTPQERIKAQDNVNFKHTASKNAWDLQSENLTELRVFLDNFA